MSIRTEFAGPVATIAFARPERKNAFTLSMMEALQAAYYEADAYPNVIGIVLTGEGDAFTAGIDAAVVEENAERGGSFPADDDRGMGEGFSGPFRFPIHVRKPVIAAINGVCAGGGLVYAAMCDLRFMAQGASIVSVFSKRGLAAEHGLSWLLPRIVGVSKALDILWSPRRIGAEAALAMGLVDRVCEPDALLAEARAYLEALSEQASPWSLMMTKRLVYRHLAVDLGTAVAESDRVMQEALGRRDVAEGFASFAERRPPRFDPLEPR